MKQGDALYVRSDDEDGFWSYSDDDCSDLYAYTSCEGAWHMSGSSSVAVEKQGCEPTSGGSHSVPGGTRSRRWHRKARQVEAATSSVARQHHARPPPPPIPTFEPSAPKSCQYILKVTHGCETRRLKVSWPEGASSAQIMSIIHEVVQESFGASLQYRGVDALLHPLDTHSLRDCLSGEVGRVIKLHFQEPLMSPPIGVVGRPSVAVDAKPYLDVVKHGRASVPTQHNNDCHHNDDRSANAWEDIGHNTFQYDETSLHCGHVGHCERYYVGGAVAEDSSVCGSEWDLVDAP